MKPKCYVQMQRNVVETTELHENMEKDRVKKRIF